MRYITLIYGNEAEAIVRSQEEQQAEFTAYNDFQKFITESGAFITGDALHPVNTATTIRVREGKVLTTDGPFAETKEQLGGFYVLKAANLDDAIALAAKIPGAATGSIEIRPIMEWE